jgi:hypothetical protein
MSVITLILLFIFIAVALALSIILAWLPMRLLLGQMARNIREFIERQRERRRVERSTPDRRHL